MLRWRLLRIIGWGLLLLGFSSWWLQAQERASDVLKGPPDRKETVSAAGEEEESTNEESATAPPETAPEAETEARDVPPEAEPISDDRVGPAQVIAIPITDVISDPNLYILRRGLKTAIEEGAAAFVIEIDTPGGSVATLIEMMGQIDRFDEQGMTISFINDEAISAGALLAAVTDEIWFAPKAVVGSAGVVMGTGDDVPETMKQKIESYLQAKIRALGSEHRYREDVVRAMMDETFELVIDGEVISPEGRMLNLTAEEAVRRYGDPPVALFGEGIAPDLESLLDARFGAGEWELTRLEVTWSEEVAKYLKGIGPLLVALGILAIFIEVKTPGFGFFGLAGIGLLGVVFLTNHIVGLAGWEPFIVMFIGLALIVIDLLLFPGTMVLMVIGLATVVGSLIWSLTDVWPTVGGGVEISPEAIVKALTDLSLAVLIGTAGLILVWRFLPRSGIFDRLVLQGAPVAGPTAVPPGPASSIPEPGSRGVVTRVLHPGGEVEINGRRYQARVDTGVLGRGEPVVVVRHLQFGLEVRRDESA